MKSDIKARLEKAREGRRKFWTAEEVAILKEAIKGGYLAVDVFRAKPPLLPGRTYGAIHIKMSQLGGKR